MSARQATCRRPRRFVDEPAGWSEMLHLAGQLGMTIRAVPVGSLSEDWIGSSPGLAVFTAGRCFVEAWDGDYPDADMSFARSVLLHEIAHFAVARVLGRTGDNYGCDDPKASFAVDDEELTCLVQLCWLIEHDEPRTDRFLHWTSIHDYSPDEVVRGIGVWRAVGLPVDEARILQWCSVHLQVLPRPGRGRASATNHA